MTPRQALVRVSTAHLAADLAGTVVAVRRHRNYDVGFMRGRPETVLRDAVLNGTAYSAPVFMMALQAWATWRLATRPDDVARGVLRVLGALMIPGYLAEHWGRARLRPSGWDPVETPVVVAGLGLAAAMHALGHLAAAGR